MDIQTLLAQFGDKYLLALLTTWKLTALAFASAFVLGIAVTILRVCPIKPLRFAGELYVQIFRNIPGAALLILLVYALPYLNLLLSYFACVYLATSLIPAAFCSEYLMSSAFGYRPEDIEELHRQGLTSDEIEEYLYCGKF